MNEKYYKCPKCGSFTKTEYYPEVSTSSKLGVVGGLGTLGALVGGPAGFAVGATVGKYINKARSTRFMNKYQSEYCKHIFIPES